MVMFWIFCIVAVTLLFALVVVRIGTRHVENLARIRHGYPTLDGDVPIGTKKADEADEDFADVLQRQAAQRSA